MVRNRELEPEIMDIVEDTKERRVVTEDEKLKKDEVEEADEKESSFSEAVLAKIIEGSHKDLSTLTTNSDYKKLQKSAKILVLYKIISQQVTELLETYLKLAEKDLHRAQKIQEDLTKMRTMQKLLLTKLFGRLEGEFPNRQLLEEEVNGLLED
jgi:tRNA(Met) C34 N-acetyltransferase TmcA